MAKSIKPSQSNQLKNVAIIMDGNGRWAKLNALQVSKGHEKGVAVVKDIVEESINQSIDSLTLYAFSSENWGRPPQEINSIKKLILKAIDEQLPDLIEQKVSLSFLIFNLSFTTNSCKFRSPKYAAFCANLFGQIVVVSRNFSACFINDLDATISPTRCPVNL